MTRSICLVTAVAAAFLVSGLCHPSFAQTETVYVFVNQDVPEEAMARTQLKSIYLGKKDRWSNNQQVTFTTLNQGPCQEVFIREYVKKSPFQFQNYWKKQVFTGMGQPPRKFDSPAALIDYVSRTTGAIGFSCQRPDTGKVKILTIN